MFLRSIEIFCGPVDWVPPYVTMTMLKWSGAHYVIFNLEKGTFTYVKRFQEWVEKYILYIINGKRK